MMRTNIRRVAACIALCACLFPASAAESMTRTIEMYFADLKADVADAVHRSTVAGGRQSRDINAGFKQLVKQHQPLTALLKTNSSGIVVNRYIRNTKMTKKKLSVAKQPWFMRPQKSLREYDCLMKDENGRYYLYWSIPLVRMQRGARHFDGVIVAKVDVWDCFHKVASKSTEAFLIRLNTTSLYGHLWENKKIFVEDPLSIAGIDKISVRYQNSGVTAIASTPEKQTTPSPPSAIAETAQAAPVENKADAVQPQTQRVTNNIPIVIGLIIIILVVLTLLIVQITGKSRPAKRVRPLSKDDHFPLR